MIYPMIESFFLDFVLLLICVLNIRNSPVGGVHFTKKVWVKKIIAVVVGYPLYAALMSWIMCLILHL